MVRGRFSYGVRSNLTKRPFGLSLRVAGHEIPPRAEISDTQRIEALEDAVRNVFTVIEDIAKRIDKLDVEAGKFDRTLRRL